MKFTITMKTSDAAEYAIEDAVGSALFDFEGTPDEEEDKRAELKEELGEFIWRWMPFGEYMTVEFDTEANTATNTATVLKAK